MAIKAKFLLFDSISMLRIPLKSTVFNRKIVSRDWSTKKKTPRFAERIRGTSSDLVTKDVDADKIQPTFKSQPEPTGVEDVKVIVASTLQKDR